MLGNIGTIHQLQGDYEQALETYRDALEDMIELKNRAGIAVMRGNMGVTYDALGNYEEALAQYEKALAEKEALGDQVGTAMTLGNIGEVHQHRGELETARKFLKRSARLARSKSAVPEEVAALAMLARLEYESGETGAALRAADSALREIEELLEGLADEQGATARQQYASLFAIGALAALREGAVPDAFRFLESGRAGALLDMLAGGARETLRRENLEDKELLRAEARALEAERNALDAYEKARARNDRLAGPARVLREARDLVRTMDARIQRRLKAQAGLGPRFARRRSRRCKKRWGRATRWCCTGSFTTPRVPRA